jgi:Tfp pilus assembly protein PilO
VNDVSSSSASTKTIAAILVIAALAAAFWIIALSPKRQQASELGAEVEQQQAALVAAQNKVAEASAARADFASDYHQLIVLGQAVPAGGETPSLLVQLNQVADHAGVQFDSLQLSSSEGGEASTTATTGLAPEVGPSSSVPTSATVPPTEAEAALLPLGATVGSAGLGVMPYNLTFRGNFFQIADFIHGIDSLVRTTNSKVGVDGRLITLDGFALTAGTEAESSDLTANFTVTTYIVPPAQGLTAGATPTSPTTPAEAETAPEAATTTGTPSSYSTSEAR